MVVLCGNLLTFPHNRVLYPHKVLDDVRQPDGTTMAI